jgi:hypothetical protein
MAAFDSDWSNNSMPPASVIATVERVILWVQSYRLVFCACSTVQLAVLQACETKPAAVRTLFTQMY